MSRRDDDPVGAWVDRQLAGRPDLDLLPDHGEGFGWREVGVEPMDCRNAIGVRPCPILSCPHHLLIDFVYTDRKEPSLALNRAGTGETGRRRELSPVEAMPDSAVTVALRRLWDLPDTCEREVTMRGDDRDENGLTIRAIARALGSEEDEVGLDLDDALCALRGAAIAADADPDDPESMRAALYDALKL